MGTIRSGAAALAMVGALVVAGCQEEAPGSGSAEGQVGAIDRGMAGDEGAVAASGTRGEAAPGSQAEAAGGRQVIELPDSARQALRMAMLRQLETLHGTAAALAEGDTARARELSAERGTAAPRRLASVIGPLAPGEFMRLSMRNHQAFDALAEAAVSEAGGPGAEGPETGGRAMHGAFASVLGACVACHQSFTAR